MVDRARAARCAGDRARLVRRAARARGPGRHARAPGAGECRVGPVRERVVRRRVLRPRGDDVRRSGLQRARGRTGASPGRPPRLLQLDRVASHVPRRGLGRHDDLASHGVRHEADHRRRVGRLRAAPRRVDPTVPPSRPRRRRPHRAAAAAGGDDDLSLVRVATSGPASGPRKRSGWSASPERPSGRQPDSCVAPGAHSVRLGRGPSCRGSRRARAGEGGSRRRGRP